MYRFTPCLTLGFHGCDKSLLDAVVNNLQTLKYSRNKYDWLGSGIYFWENDYDRALDFAKNHPGRKIKSPAVLGAVIDPGFCLNLLNTKDRELVKKSHETIKNRIDNFERTLLSNYRNNNGLHNLDCLVIENLHNIRHSLNQPPFESIRGAFTEGPELYPGAGFREKDHIQLCIRNPNCIKAFFIPRPEVEWPRINQLS
jgi:hypothetical protein